MKPCAKYLLALAITISLGGACAPRPATPTATPFISSAGAGPSTPPAATLTGPVRPAAVAGSWYPADSQTLTQMIDGYLAAVEAVDGAPVALIVPHAGYEYSGQTAAYAFKQLENGTYDTAVIIAADHKAPVSNPISIWASGGFATPLGIVPVDTEIAQALFAVDSRITADVEAHAGEHVIEIELPFLQRVCPACRLVPVLMGAEDEETIQALSQALIAVLNGRRAVIIASSDLSHYPEYRTAQAVDGETLAAIETGDDARVLETISRLMQAGTANLQTCACGAGPIRVAMRTARGLGADMVTILNYANSGDSRGADRSQVVGYGAVMLWRYNPPDLPERLRLELLQLARQAIAGKLENGRIPEYHTTDPNLTRKSGAFVTLRQYGELRGCIGRMQADWPLYRVIQEMAVAAATADPRFMPLTLNELDSVKIEISVLSPLRRVTDLDQIVIGEHGLMIVQSGRSGVFLPQVPVEQGWNRDAYLTNLCGKAGLPADCWLHDPRLYSFTALVFGED